MLRVKEMFLTRSQTKMPHILVRIESVLVLYTESKTCHGRIANQLHCGPPCSNYKTKWRAASRLHSVIQLLLGALIPPDRSNDKDRRAWSFCWVRVCYCTPYHLSRSGGLVSLRWPSRRKAICKSITGSCRPEAEGGSEYPTITSRVP